ncbi:spermidine/putrescine transport system permease protein [Dongia mobilis]|uniref:Spermidine/putrescine transport system permease protein n=1 Tax=Dongia mobilis TaxID=578943 RepID=A0A4R6WKC0_9PROT|nr:ABC transporter permease subunit [Dongia mobilis]TDQ81003.1 spermidine/putrescine transport system permease protein [Dongia mobilis]
MISARRFWGTLAMALACGGTAIFLLLPPAVLLGLGLYYVFGIALVADLSQVLAAVAQETDIAPALLATPLIALCVTLLAGIWGLALSLLWRDWLAAGRLSPLLLTALPLILPRFVLGALFLLAGLQVAQWGGNILGGGLVITAQAAVAAPVVAGLLALGWRRVDPGWYRAAQEAGADEATIFRRLAWPILRPYLALGALLTFFLSFDDFYLANALSGEMPLLSATLFSGIARSASPLYFALLALVLLLDIVLVVLLARLLRPLLPLQKDLVS